MYERNVGVQSMNSIEIAYISRKNIESNIQKLHRKK